jgi:hypothetical protein
LQLKVACSIEMYVKSAQDIHTNDSIKPIIIGDIYDLYCFWQGIIAVHLV